MKFAIDFDGTLVSDDRDYGDTETPYEFMPGARDALEDLAEAGHTLILYSARANLALRRDWHLNPLWSEKPKWLDYEVNDRRYQHMLEWLKSEGLIELFAYVDDGEQGKVSADVYVDDKAIRFGDGRGSERTWNQIRHVYGESRR